MTQRIGEKKYFVKGGWIFNLEAMHDHLWCIIYDMRDEQIKPPVTIAGKQYYNEGEIRELMDECGDLEWYAKSGRVTGQEYGRIKAIVEYRVGCRYAKCMNSGMSERDAGECFADL